ncbi:MAG: TatD family hydrolase [Clostridia bacterium]|nr:TatD family hydrolase [Clostridia bacterium]
MKLFDTHAHCDDLRIQNEFEGGTEGYILYQLDNGVANIVNIGTNLDNSRVSIDLAKRITQVYATCGIHPYDIRFYNDVDTALASLKAMLAEEKVVALGEIGLDYHYEDSDFQKQMVFFVKQMELAGELNIPVVIHDRDAHGDTMDVIRRFPEVTGIFHSFSGSAEMANELIERGWYISFSGPITYKNAKKPKEACKICPLDRILIETDAPYLPPTPYRGQMNHPHYVVRTAEEIAGIHGISVDEVAEITYENAKKVYRIRD